MARSLALPAVLFIALIFPTAALADSTWTRISRDGLGTSLSRPELALDGGRVVASWYYDDPANPPVGDQTIEAVSFEPSLTADAVNLQGPTNATPGFTLVGYPHGLVPKAGGGLQILFAGLKPGDPNTFTYSVARNPDGSYGAPQPATNFGTKWGDVGATVLPDGTPVFASYSTGAITVGRGIDPTQNGIELQGAIGNCCGYAPSLGVDASGRLWIAWYSNATNATGLYVQQLDPATGNPVAPAQKAPQSESSSNNTFRAPLACAAVCRTVYRIDGTLQGVLNKIVTWAPGEGAPTFAAPSNDQTLGFEGGAAYRADGRLWIAWWENEGQTLGGHPAYKVTLGDANGAGGIVEAIGQPPDLGNDGAVTVLPVGDNLVIAATVTNLANSSAVWANVVAPPVEAVAAPGPPNVELEVAGKKFFIRVQYRVKIPCSNPCAARAEIRTRSGRRIYASVPLPGDGKLVLGKVSGLKLSTKGKIRFNIPVNKKQLLKAPFLTRAGHRVAETRMRVWLKTPSGEVLTVRDGAIRVSIARIKSGALPGLRPIL